MNRTALLVDDDALVREFLSEALRTLGYRVVEATSGEEGLSACRGGEPDLVLTDLRLPGIDGLEVLRGVKERFPEVPILVLTAYGTVETAVQAMRSGAEDFILKPVSPEQLEVVLGRIEARRSLVHENKALRASLTEGTHGLPVIVGTHPRFIQALALAERVAPTDATVLIRGESGTGKEVVASILHHRSPRSKSPFIRVNCAALTESLLTSELFGHERGAFTGAHARKEGRFELATTGTLFLDEIGEMPLEVQAKLLRILETGEFERVGGTKTLTADARIIAATNRNLEEAMAKGRFREDLYYRLNVVPVVLPALRERVEDIPLLARHFVKRFAKEHGSPVTGFRPEALAALLAAEWPGNVRELANTIQRAVLVADGREIGARELGLPERVPKKDAGAFASGTLEEVERVLILGTLERTGWNRVEAARRLGVTSRTLSNKLKLWRTLGLVAAAH